MNTLIFFIRHGHVHNPKNIIYGHLPGYELSQKGKKQVQESAVFLKNTSIKTVYSSPLLRAKQTTIILHKELNIPTINYSDDITEIKSSLQGKSFEYFRSIKINYYDPKIRKSDDETIEDIAKRMSHFIQHIIAKHKGQSIAVVSHGEPIMILSALINKQPLTIKSIRPGRNRYVQYAEVRKIQSDGKSLDVQTVFIPK